MFLSYIVPLSILLPILICLYHFKSSTTSERLLFFYLVTSGLINMAALIIVKYKMTNLPLLHLYTAIEAIFILSYFRTIFAEPLIKKALLITTVLFPIFCALNFFFLQKTNFNTNTRPLEAIIITFFCLLYLYKSGFTEHWLNKSTNWFNIGILIYFPAACIIFILSNYVVFKTMDKSMKHLVWNVHAALVFIMYLVWARGFSLIKKNG
jgi:hypothetical protein